VFNYLLGGDWNHGMFNDFPYVGNVIIPIGGLIFFRGVGIPPTRFTGRCLWGFVHPKL
jgi:hypothetical protein